MGERLQKAKIRCQAAEATKPIDLEEVGAIGRLGMDGPLVPVGGRKSGGKFQQKYEYKNDIE